MRETDFGEEEVSEPRPGVIVGADLGGRGSGRRESPAKLGMGVEGNNPVR